MPEQINSASDFFVNLESDIPGADATNDGSTSGNASTSPALLVGYYNATRPTLSSGSAGALQIDPNGGLWIRQRLGFSYASALTVDTTAAYSIGDTLVAPVSIANAVGLAGEQLVLDSVVFVTSTNVTPAFDLVFFRDTVTVGAVNTSWGINSTDARKQAGRVQFVAADWVNDGTPNTAQRHNIGFAISTTGTSLIFALKATGAVSFTGTTDLHVSMEFRRL